MPRDSMKYWLEELNDVPVEVPNPSGLDELVPTRLPFPPDPELPEGVVLHNPVILRGGDDPSVEPVADILVPDGEGPWPVHINVHGGAWFRGSRIGNRKFAARLALEGFVVVNVDYRLAPEHRFPAGLEDVIYAVRWTKQNIAQYGGKADSITIGGGSAGSNLAAAAVLHLHAGEGELDGGDLDGVEVNLKGALLQWGVSDLPHWLVNPHYYRGFVDLYALAYLGERWTLQMDNPLVSPAYSKNLGKFCPTYLVCGALDAVLPQTIIMAEKLIENDVSTTVSIVADADHEFIAAPPHRIPQANAEFRRIVDWMHSIHA